MDHCYTEMSISSPSWAISKESLRTAGLSAQQWARKLSWSVGTSITKSQ